LGDRVRDSEDRRKSPIEALNGVESQMGVIDMCDEFGLIDRPRRGRPEAETVRLAAAGLMASGIVHDFRNLMQVISSAMRLIEKNLDRPALLDVAPFINGALQSVDRANALSRQLLGVSREESAPEEAVCLESVLAAMRLPICWSAGPDVRVELALDGDAAAVFCCAREFENVVLNLVINAKDAMPNGGALRIAVYRGSVDDGATVVVRVTDTGCGMSAETARRAFRPLFTTKSVGYGTGLGLAMVSDFARRVGGSVQIESAANRGTSIILRLPACRN
jgi:signal transduction histidine kinase